MVALDAVVQRLHAQPFFDVIDPIAARQRSCCPAPSNTIRTVRTRTYGNYLFVVLFMKLHPTHELELLANPARFNQLNRCFFSHSMTSSISWSI